MKLIEKILNERRMRNGVIISNGDILKEECEALGLKSDNIIRRMIRGDNTDGVANGTVVKIERRYGYSFEELIDEVK